MVSALNARFRAGRPSDDPALAGVAVHSIDNRVTDQQLIQGLGPGGLIWRSETMHSGTDREPGRELLAHERGASLSLYENARMGSRVRAIVGGGQARLAVQLSMGRWERPLSMPNRLALVGHVCAGLPIRG